MDMSTEPSLLGKVSVKGEVWSVIFIYKYIICINWQLIKALSPPPTPSMKRWLTSPSLAIVQTAARDVTLSLRILGGQSLLVSCALGWKWKLGLVQLCAYMQIKLLALLSGGLASSFALMQLQFSKSSGNLLASMVLFQHNTNTAK